MESGRIQTIFECILLGVCIPQTSLGSSQLSIKMSKITDPADLVCDILTYFKEEPESLYSCFAGSVYGEKGGAVTQGILEFIPEAIKRIKADKKRPRESSDNSIADAMDISAKAMNDCLQMYAQMSKGGWNSKHIDNMNQRIDNLLKLSDEVVEHARKKLKEYSSS